MTNKSFCGRKVIYSTFTKAQKAMINLMRKKNETYLHVYKCPDCQKFHVGHKRESERDYKEVKTIRSN